MKTQHELALKLKTLMAQKPLDEISVSLLSKKCNINRQSFYYYFHDIYDLLTQVFLDEKIEGYEDCKDFNELLEKVFKYYQCNSKFIDAVVESAGRDLFQEFLFNIFYQSTLRFVEKFKESSLISPVQKKNLARFYASGFSHSIVYYLSTHRHKTLNGLLSSFNFVMNNELKASVENLKRKEVSRK